MIHNLGRTTLIASASLFLLIIFIYSLDKNNIEENIITPVMANKSGIKDLDVEYSNGKIYLNIELNSPKRCEDLINELKIEPITIKSRTYYPSCISVSKTSLRIIYIQQIST